MGKLRQLGRRFRDEIATYRRVIRDPRTPRRARTLLRIAVAYALLPFDVVPDFIPVIGHLDDAIIIPAFIWLALRSVPPDVMRDARAAGTEGRRTAR